MCLSTKTSEKSTKSWLEKQPDAIIAYKVVRKIDGKYYPACVWHGHGTESLWPKRMNRIKEARYPTSTEKDDRIYYRPYYHLFMKKNKALQWGDSGDVILECEVPKKDITAIGSQDGGRTVVAKAFKIIKEVG